MRLLSIIFALVMFLSSCSIVTKVPESLSNNIVTCEKTMSKSLALVWVFDEDTRKIDPEKKKSDDEIKKSYHEEKLLNTRCFEKVKTFDDENMAKDFDRIIRMKVKLQSPSGLEITGHAFWIFISASTLFLLPYFHTENIELTLEDSKTGFSRTYNFTMKYTAHISYFFNDWDFQSPIEKDYEIMNDFLNELKARP